MTGTELVRAGEHINESAAAYEAAMRGRVESDLAVEDYATEREKWEGGNAADRRVAAAYQALEEGRNLISLSKAIISGGFDGEYRPRLAIAPCGVSTIYVETWKDSSRVQFRTTRQRALIRWRMELDFGGAHYRGLTTQALLPQMPPAVREIASRRDLLLWEAEWRRTNFKRAPRPRDPALLEQVAGDLYVVKASWELSELEAAALR